MLERKEKKMEKVSMNKLEMARRAAKGGSGGTIPPATSEKLGGVKIGAGVNVSEDGTISVPSYVPPAYSADEVNTGKKDIDGYDIYSKSFTVASLPNSTDAVFNHGITGIHRVVKLYGSAQNADKTVFFPLPYVAQQNFEGCIKLSMNTTQISIWAGSNRSNLEGVITVEYTKEGV